MNLHAGRAVSSAHPCPSLPERGSVRGDKALLCQGCIPGSSETESCCCKRSESVSSTCGVGSEQVLQEREVQKASSCRIAC